MSTERPDVFPVAVEWEGRRLTRVRGSGGPPLEIATPPMFPEGMHGYWSPEELLVGAVGSCLMLTFVAACAARELPLHDLRVKAIGRAGRRGRGAYGFQGIDVTISVQAPPERFEQLQGLVERAHRNCIVATALEVPIEIRLDLRASDSQVAVLAGHHANARPA